MADFVNNGNTIPYTPDGADVTAGDVVVLNSDVIGVVVADTEDGQLGALYVDGVFRFDTSATITVGENAYWNATSEEITDDNTDVYAGRVTEVVSTTQLDVKINFKPEASGS
jgi:predicted RecA/RadA family phage recombinase